MSIKKFFSIIGVVLGFFVVIAGYNKLFWGSFFPCQQFLKMAGCCRVQSGEWYGQLPFKDKLFSFQFVRRLGHATAGGADIGECFSVAQKINDGDFDGWYREWRAIADKFAGQAFRWEKEGHMASAGELLMRASNYYLSAGFFLVDERERQQSFEVWKKSRDCFIKASKLLYPDGSVAYIKIPYGDNAIPGYFCRGRGVKGDAPLFIVHSGFDGSAEDIFWDIGISAVKRGYHCLIFEGPGQGEMIIKDKIPFRFDWEVPVKAVVDFAETLAGVDRSRIALMGRSFGGYLAPRAAAFEKRIKACIANGGVFDFSRVFTTNLPKALLALLEKSPALFDKMIIESMKSMDVARWAVGNGMRRFAAKGPADLIKKTKKYRLKDVVKHITCPVLVVDSEDESGGLIGQSKDLYDALECEKTFLLFKREDAAQAHCQVGANLISTEKIFNWLDKVLA